MLVVCKNPHQFGVNDPAVNAFVLLRKLDQVPAENRLHVFLDGCRRNLGQEAEFADQFGEVEIHLFGLVAQVLGEALERVLDAGLHSGALELVRLGRHLADKRQQPEGEPLEFRFHAVFVDDGNARILACRKFVLERFPFQKRRHPDQVSRSHGKHDRMGRSGLTGDEFAFFENDDAAFFALGGVYNKTRLHALVRGRDNLLTRGLI